MKFIFFAVFSSILFAQEFDEVDSSAGQLAVQIDIASIAQDLTKLGYDILLLVQDAGNYVFLRMPSSGTLVTDGVVDGALRTIEPIEKFLARLEKSNPVNAAIVRDFSKTLTVGYKMWMLIPVDQSGRLYDRTDFYSQATKVLFKGAGFAGLALVGSSNSLVISGVNVFGDVFSQVFVDAGKDWREFNVASSFESYLGDNYTTALWNAAVSVPAKSWAGYAIGAGLKYINLERSVGAMVDVGLTRVAMNPQDGFLTKFTKLALISTSKSVFLTTGCKVAMDLTRPVTRVISNFYQSFGPAAKQTAADL